MATTKQCHIIAGRMVEFQSRFEKLPTEEAQWLIQNAGEGIDLFIDAVTKRPKKPNPTSHLSEVITSTTFPDRTETFVVKDKFVLNDCQLNKVKIAYLDDNFAKWFMILNEKPSASTTIYGRKIIRKMYDDSIINKLSGPQKGEVTLADIFAMLQLQAHGEDGALRTDGYCNLFFKENMVGVQCVISINWGINDGWYIGAGHLNINKARRPGNMVFSLVPSIVGVNYYNANSGCRQIEA